MPDVRRRRVDDARRALEAAGLTVGEVYEFSVARILRTWKVRIDETFFLGGVPKHKILESFSPHIFFDDQHQHCEGASRVVPTARVPHKD